MNIQRELEKLRQEGIEVEVLHERYIENPEWTDNLFHKGQTFPSGPTMQAKRFYPRGGRTTVTLIVKTPVKRKKQQVEEERRIVGVAVCSARDNYNKNLGVQAALGRALTGMHYLKRDSPKWFTQKLKEGEDSSAVFAPEVNSR